MEKAINGQQNANGSVTEDKEDVIETKPINFPSFNDFLSRQSWQYLFFSMEIDYFPPKKDKTLKVFEEGINLKANTFAIYAVAYKPTKPAYCRILSLTPECYEKAKEFIEEQHSLLLQDMIDPSSKVYDQY